MDYRDERDALRARIESLEGALGSAQAEVERMRATEAALEASKREVVLLRSELHRLRPGGPPRQNGRMGLFIAACSGVMAIAFGAAFLLRSGPVPPPPPTIQEPVWVSPVVPVPPPAVTLVEPPTPAEPPRPPPPARVARTASVEWKATVARSQGGGPPPGTSCTIVADLSGNGQEADASEVEVSCGTKFLYRSSDPFDGMSSNGSEVTEAAGKTAGTLQYTLAYQDQGARSGRSQISIDTSQRSGTVWSDNAPTFRVDLRMEPLSPARPGEPLIDPENRKERLREAVVRTGKVMKLEGTPGVAVGSACTVDVSPVTSSSHNCRIRVRCGGKLFYGDKNSGFNVCALKEGSIGRLVDERPSSKDSDPMLDMDLAEDTVTVADDAEPAWKLTIDLTKAAR